MRIASIGFWEFDMPDGLFDKSAGRSTSYFESEDGTLGLYVKALELEEPRATARDLTEYIQDVHLRAFTEEAGNAWQIVDERISTDGDLARSALDLYDESAKYRVLSLVLGTNMAAVQLTVHDYWCEDYAATRQRFTSLESSIVKVASAA